MLQDRQISVIVPAYNTEKYIRGCIDSILRSTYENFELIVVDDGSTDETVSIAESFTDARVQVVRMQHEGVSAARNRGLELARGEYIAFVDSDDRISAKMLARLIETTKQYDADIVICNQYDETETSCVLSLQDDRPVLVYEDKGVEDYLLKFLLKRRKEYEPYFLVGSVLGTLYRSSLLRDHGQMFPVGLQYKEDAIFSLWVGHYAKRVVWLNEALYYHVENWNSLTKYEFKSGMLPRVERAVWERRRFIETCYPEDRRFQKGLDEYLIRTYLGVIVPACAAEKDRRTCERMLKEEPYRIALKRVDPSGFDIRYQAIIWLCRHHGVGLFYGACKIKKMLEHKRRLN